MNGTPNPAADEEAQKACYTAADNATDTEDAKLMFNMLGVYPDKNYQHLLRLLRKARKE